MFLISFMFYALRYESFNANSVRFFLFFFCLQFDVPLFCLKPITLPAVLPYLCCSFGFSPISRTQIFPAELCVCGVRAWPHRHGRSGGPAQPVWERFWVVRVGEPVVCLRPEPVRERPYLRLGKIENSRAIGVVVLVRCLGLFRGEIARAIAIGAVVLVRCSGHFRANRGSFSSERPLFIN